MSLTLFKEPEKKGMINVPEVIKNIVTKYEYSLQS